MKKKTFILNSQMDLTKAIDFIANLDLIKDLWKVTIQEDDGQTERQRRFHFAVCTEIGMKKGISTDPRICKKVMHEYYKAMFLPVEHYPVDGTIVDIFTSTKEYPSAKEMAEHTTKCIAHAASEFGIILDRDMQDESI